MKAPLSLLWLLTRHACVLTLVACAPTSEQPPFDAARPPEVSATRRPMLPTASCPDGAVIELELAMTEQEITQGLMFRPELPANRGMLFLFGETRVPNFWMKDTLVPLDLVFLDDSGLVVDLIEDAQPCHVNPCPHYVPKQPAAAVLEVNSGFVTAHAIQPGNTLRFERVPGYPVPEPQTPAQRLE
jgi:uncharacterized membrane protein (UPF0127 family)